jgi:hypothetical protein
MADDDTMVDVGEVWILDLATHVSKTSQKLYPYL